MFVSLGEAQILDQVPGDIDAPDHPPTLRAPESWISMLLLLFFALTY